jgi:hypothetical protein
LPVANSIKWNYSVNGGRIDGAGLLALQSMPETVRKKQ